MSDTSNSKLAYSLVILMALLASALILATGIACGSSTGDGSDGEAPAEGGADPRIRNTEGMYTIDDLKAAGVKANKDYDVEDLPGSGCGLGGSSLTVSTTRFVFTLITRRFWMRVYRMSST